VSLSSEIVKAAILAVEKPASHFWKPAANRVSNLPKVDLDKGIAGKNFLDFRHW
jgi:hypothetical protein